MALNSPHSHRTVDLILLVTHPPFCVLMSQPGQSQEMLRRPEFPCLILGLLVVAAGIAQVRSIMM